MRDPDLPAFSTPPTIIDYLLACVVCYVAFELF